MMTEVEKGEFFGLTSIFKVIPDCTRPYFVLRKMKFTKVKRMKRVKENVLF